MDKHLAPAGEFLLYQSDDDRVRVECRFEAETFWLSQATMAELYAKDVRTINEHLVNIFAEGELAQNSTIRKFRIVRLEDKQQVAREIDHYNLEGVLAVGYRVRSTRGTQFRQWATQTWQEYLVKGFVMDDERLKNPPVGCSIMPDYFGEMLARIRDIRASERRVYLREREIFALAADYQPSLKETSRFFQAIQNKLHFACSGKTAAELIYQRADATLPHMGLTSFKGDEVRKGDVTVANNYLSTRVRLTNLTAWSICGWILPKIRPDVDSRYFYVTGKKSWINFCNLTIATYYREQARSVKNGKRQNPGRI